MDFTDRCSHDHCQNKNWEMLLSNTSLLLALTMKPTIKGQPRMRETSQILQRVKLGAMRSVNTTQTLWRLCSDQTGVTGDKNVKLFEWMNKSWINIWICGIQASVISLTNQHFAVYHTASLTDEDCSVSEESEREYALGVFVMSAVVYIYLWIETRWML